MQGSRRYVGAMDPSGAELVAQRLQYFSSLVEGPEAELMLDEAALAMSAVLQPRLDVIEWLSMLDEFAATCRTPTREGVITHLVGEIGFIGDRRSYGDWRNSCLDRVIAGRRGIPISLSVVVIEVARRLGVSLHGIGMPAHFLVGDPADPEWFCDPFNGGRFLDADGARSLLSSLTHDQIAWHRQHLDPVPARLVIARMLNNLKAAFTQRKDLLRLSLVMQMRIAMVEFDSEREQAQRLRFVLN
jgi:regulator of sirC expression with transglutaminase-like and TPR domain